MSLNRGKSLAFGPPGHLHNLDFFHTSTFFSCVAQLTHTFFCSYIECRGGGKISGAACLTLTGINDLSTNNNVVVWQIIFGSVNTRPPPTCFPGASAPAAAYYPGALPNDATSRYTTWNMTCHLWHNEFISDTTGPDYDDSCIEVWYVDRGLGILLLQVMATKLFFLTGTVTGLRISCAALGAGRRATASRSMGPTLSRRPRISTSSRATILARAPRSTGPRMRPRALTITASHPRIASCLSLALALSRASTGPPIGPPMATWRTNF